MNGYGILLRSLCVTLCVGLVTAGAGRAQPSLPTIDPFNNRHALVIGNGAYKGSPLNNPVNDAADMADALRSVGFKVTSGKDLDLPRMRLTIQQFVSSLPSGAAAFIFYAGHGVQHAGQNYLLPVDAIGQVSAARDLDRAAINVGDMLRDIEGAGPAITVLFLDACRNSPFSTISEIESGLARTVSRSSRGGSQGNPAKGPRPSLEGVLISYSTAPNAVAADGTGRNSPYTAFLKRYIAAPNTTLETVLKSTRSGVTKDTQGRQTPWYESSINGDFYPAGSDQISIDALLGMFLPDKDRNFIPGGTYMMPWDPTERSPINWHHAGIRSGPNSGDVKLETMSSSWTAPFSRTGDVIITVDGKPTHTVLDRTRKPVRWKITMLGARNGALVINLSNDVWSQEFDGFGDRKFLSEERACRKHGSTVYAINLPDKIPAWLSESRSCGSAGCGFDYQLFTDRSEKARLGCRENPTNTQKSERPVFMTAGGAWVGKWYTGKLSVCRGEQGQTEGLLVFSTTKFWGYENECDVERIKPVGAGVEIVSKCSGEGMESREREYLEVLDGRLKRTTLVNRKRMTFTYDRCPS